MKIYIIFSGSSYPYANGDIIGVFSNKEDADDMINSCKGDESFLEEHEVIVGNKN